MWNLFSGPVKLVFVLKLTAIFNLFNTFFLFTIIATLHWLSFFSAHLGFLSNCFRTNHAIVICSLEELPIGLTNSNLRIWQLIFPLNSPFISVLGFLCEGSRIDFSIDHCKGFLEIFHLYIVDNYDKGQLLSDYI